MPLSSSIDIATPRENTSEEELVAIIEKFPYYYLPRFYLLCRQKKTPDSAGLALHARKAGLFFTNHRWLDHQANNYSKIQSELYKHNDISELSGLDISGNAMQEPSREANNPNDAPGAIAFEPLHTVDYFASQGIKISDEPVATDKLSAQLKSFTEWLKTMKKVHVTSAPSNDEHTDTIIQRMAETSNVNTNIVTEAMAEVLAKQGKREQAIDIYEKLSLNNPSKSAYFAAKIESLKSV